MDFSVPMRARVGLLFKTTVTPRPQEQDLSRIVGRLDRLLEDLGRSRSGHESCRSPTSSQCRFRGMLADNEERLAACDPVEQLRGAEVAGHAIHSSRGWTNARIALVGERSCRRGPSSRGMTSTTSSFPAPGPRDHQGLAPARRLADPRGCATLRDDGPVPARVDCPSRSRVPITIQQRLHHAPPTHRSPA